MSSDNHLCEGNFIRDKPNHQSTGLASKSFISDYLKIERINYMNVYKETQPVNYHVVWKAIETEYYDSKDSKT